MEEVAEAGALSVDQLLVRGVAAGDEQSFAQLYARFEPVARRSARRAARTHPQLDVDEVINLSLARLWAALPTFDDERELAPWAAVVIAHAVRSAAKATRSVKSTVNWGAMLAPAGAGDGTADVLARIGDRGDALAPLEEAEQSVLVAALLRDVLSKREATVMRMRLSGWTYAEMSAHLEVDVKAIDNALRRGTERLRAAFGSASEVSSYIDGLQA